MMIVLHHPGRTRRILRMGGRFRYVVVSQRNIKKVLYRR